mgnify:CR=1 FL=1
MPKEAHKVVVIGHRNPDTDSICSAIAYAELKKAAPARWSVSRAVPVK